MSARKENITFSFPEEFDSACQFFDSVEGLENLAGIEFSCGEGHFISDILDNDELLEKFDGKVDVSVIRVTKPRSVRVHQGPFRVTLDYFHDLSISERIRNVRVLLD